MITEGWGFFFPIKLYTLGFRRTPLKPTRRANWCPTLIHFTSLVKPVSGSCKCLLTQLLSPTAKYAHSSDGYLALAATV